MHDFLSLNIITKRSKGPVVSIVKLSYDMFYLVSGPFLLKKTHFAKLDENAKSVSGIVRKVYIIDKIPFRGLQMGLLQTFWWEDELSKLFGSGDRILPILENGRSQ